MTNKNILIIDDSITMRKMVAYTLQESGYEVEESANGLEALAKLDSLQYDLIIADVNMPVMDGISFVREARSKTDYKYTPILMLTTESTGERIQLGRQAGATGWLVKPFQPNRLIDAVKRVIQ